MRDSAAKHVTIVLLAIALGTAGFFADPSAARGASGEQIDHAIRRATQWIYKQQNKEGNFEYVPAPINKIGSDPNGGQWGGLTAISTYALLAAGESPNDPRIVKAVDFLKRANIKGTYALSLRCQVWLLIGSGDKSIGPFLKADAEQLQEGMIRQGLHAGMFAYACDGGPQPPGYFDHSVSQYGVLGLWALEECGIDIPLATWRIIDQTWRKDQHVDGAWSYENQGAADSPQHGSGNPSMTAAGIATLLVTQDYARAGTAGSCKANEADENVERGLRWMDQHAAGALNPTYLYAMYGIERIGAASGRKYFSTTAWYETGADAIVDKQSSDGSWGSIPDTAFALLFLVRGRAPVMMNKLQYDVAGLATTTYEGPWNERPREVAHFARWMSRNLERDLNWQVVNLKVSGDDLRDAPIVYVSGSDELRMPDAEVDHLHQYIDAGGMILGNADCGKKEFADSFVKLGQRMFPGYTFRELEEDHPIFTREQFPASAWKQRPIVLGLSNGVRELMVLAPDVDLGRAWQMRAEKEHAVEYQLGADIFVYSIDKRALRYKGESPVIRPNPRIAATRTLKLARLEVGDNWDPEPGGWRRMAALLHNDFQLDLDVQPVKLEPGSLAGFRIAHLTGTTPVLLSDVQRKTLADFVTHGGTLVIDAAGGSKAFADSADAELRAMLPTDAPKGLSAPLPPFAPLYTLAEAPIRAFTYRSFARPTLGPDAKSPRLDVIEHNGRPAVYFSREDLSAGLVGQAVDGIRGYSPETATEIMRNILLVTAGSTK